MREARTGLDPTVKEGRVSSVTTARNFRGEAVDAGIKDWLVEKHFHYSVLRVQVQKEMVSLGEDFLYSEENLQVTEQTSQLLPEVDMMEEKNPQGNCQQALAAKEVDLMNRNHLVNHKKSKQMLHQKKKKKKAAAAILDQETVTALITRSEEVGQYITVATSTNPCVDNPRATEPDFSFMDPSDAEDLKASWEWARSGSNDKAPVSESRRDKLAVDAMNYIEEKISNFYGVIRTITNQHDDYFEENRKLETTGRRTSFTPDALAEQLIMMRDAAQQLPDKATAGAFTPIYEQLVGKSIDALSRPTILPFSGTAAKIIAKREYGAYQKSVDASDEFVPVVREARIDGKKRWEILKAIAKYEAAQRGLDLVDALESAQDRLSTDESRVVLTNGGTQAEQLLVAQGFLTELLGGAERKLRTLVPQKEWQRRVNRIRVKSIAHASDRDEQSRDANTASEGDTSREAIILGGARIKHPDARRWARNLRPREREDTVQSEEDRELVRAQNGLLVAMAAGKLELEEVGRNDAIRDAYSALSRLMGNDYTKQNIIEVLAAKGKPNERTVIERRINEGMDRFEQHLTAKDATDTAASGGEQGNGDGLPDKADVFVAGEQEAIGHGEETDEGQQGPHEKITVIEPKDRRAIRQAMDIFRDRNRELEILREAGNLPRLDHNPFEPVDQWADGELFREIPLDTPRDMINQGVRSRLTASERRNIESGRQQFVPDRIGFLFDFARKHGGIVMQPRDSLFNGHYLVCVGEYKGDTLALLESGLTKNATYGLPYKLAEASWDFITRNFKKYQVRGETEEGLGIAVRTIHAQVESFDSGKHLEKVEADLDEVYAKIQQREAEQQAGNQQ